MKTSDLTVRPHMLVARKIQFRCLHKYEQPDFSPSKNEQTFGLCYSPFGHGHVYTLEAYFAGHLDSKTGMIVNLSHIDDLLKETVSVLNDRHVNFEIGEFKTQIPTTENLSHYLWDHLVANMKQRAEFAEVALSRLRLYESETLWVDIVSPSA